MLKKTFRVEDMHCANCAMKIESLEDDMPGVLQVLASYHKLQITVEYDDAKVSDIQIIEAVKEIGYTAQLIG